MAPPLREGDLRCLCPKKPLLGKYGRDRTGALYVHVKVYKGGKVFGEIILQGGGTARIRCRECERWHTVNIRQDKKVDFQVEELPATLSGV